MRKKRKSWEDVLTTEEKEQLNDDYMVLWRDPRFSKCQAFAKKYDKLAKRMELEEPGTSTRIVFLLYLCFKKIMFNYRREEIKKAFTMVKSVKGIVSIFLYKMLCGLACKVGLINFDIDFLLEVLPLVRGKGNKKMICDVIDSIQHDIEVDAFFARLDLDFE